MFVTIIFATATIYYAIMLVLILIPGRSAWKSGASARLLGLGRVVYSDGIKYYIFIFILSLLNLIATLKLPSVSILFIILEGVFGSVLSCRVVLHIRQQGIQQIPHT
ncbi:hypothetical protein P691DRAFT_769691 [Macrolepiota fuliginosa MF-IS2]|uniref:Uncharacterized protein n=1 Tax=Macrolepiota fuliginosa MF-IS2 TaxID=1400762 RepID=A0A9P6BVF2_9AGAR|nr:hypothetical protein P691DRAFT_769691 [Macrolepiota fuliginosa MF-IS2]